MIEKGALVLALPTRVPVPVFDTLNVRSNVDPRTTGPYASELGVTPITGCTPVPESATAADGGAQGEPPAADGGSACEYATDGGACDR